MGEITLVVVARQVTMPGHKGPAPGLVAAVTVYLFEIENWKLRIAN